VHSLPNRGVIDEVATRGSFSAINRDRYILSVTARAGNPVSHKYVVKKKKKEVKSLLTRVINLDSRFSQGAKTEEVICTKHVFQRTVTGNIYELLLFTSR
jgi:hypothetical protein